MGLSDYPSNSRKRLEGVAVGLFVRYGSVCIGTQGGPLCTACQHGRMLRPSGYDTLQIA